MPAAGCPRAGFIDAGALQGHCAAPPRPCRRSARRQALGTQQICAPPLRARGHEAASRGRSACGRATPPPGRPRGTAVGAQQGSQEQYRGMHVAGLLDHDAGDASAMEGAGQHQEPPHDGDPGAWSGAHVPLTSADAAERVDEQLYSRVASGDAPLGQWGWDALGATGALEADSAWDRAPHYVGPLEVQEVPGTLHCGWLMRGATACAQAHVEAKGLYPLAVHWVRPSAVHLQPAPGCVAHSMQLLSTSSVRCGLQFGWAVLACIIAYWLLSQRGGAGAQEASVKVLIRYLACGFAGIGVGLFCTEDVAAGQLLMACRPLAQLRAAPHMSPSALPPQEQLASALFTAPLSPLAATWLRCMWGAEGAGGLAGRQRAKVLRQLLGQVGAGTTPMSRHTKPGKLTGIGG